MRVSKSRELPIKTQLIVLDVEKCENIAWTNVYLEDFFGLTAG